VDHNQQTSNQGTPAADEIKPEQSKYCWNPAILKEVTFQRNNLSWTQEGKHISIHKLVPVVQALFLGFFSKKGRCWDPWL